jgi:hypothetical protein
MLKKSASFVHASLRPSTYPRGYASALRSLRPCWTAFLSILCDVSYCSGISDYSISTLPQQFLRKLLVLFTRDGSTRNFARKLAIVAEALMNNMGYGRPEGTSILSPRPLATLGGIPPHLLRNSRAPLSRLSYAYHDDSDRVEKSEVYD